MNNVHQIFGMPIVIGGVVGGTCAFLQKKYLFTAING